jgi:alanine-glyoxylate transaminase / serine-glyoxylate transaminase / serine-pyruvate transaminase
VKVPAPTSRRAGSQFLQIPGPTNVPERVLHAMARATIDHRGQDFRRLFTEVIERLEPVLGTRSPIVIFPASGTGAWEAALVNTLSPGDRVVAFETGHFATLWKEVAERLGLVVDFIPGDWRSGVDPAAVSEHLSQDEQREIKAVLVVHNETSTGVMSDLAGIRAAIDRVGHPALLMVDTISSLGSVPYRHDDWRVDVTIGCSQKGLMLPPGLSFNALSARVLTAVESAELPRAYWDWRPVLTANADGMFPYTPPTNLLFGLREALTMLAEEGLDAVYARHERHAEATRTAARAWGLDILCRNDHEHSRTLTTIVVPAPHNADEIRADISNRFDLVLGGGLGRLQGGVIRIGHLGDLNDLMLCGTLCGIEMGFRRAGVALRGSGVEAALAYLAGSSVGP